MLLINLIDYSIVRMYNLLVINCSMKVFKKEDGVYWVVLAIVVLIVYFVFSDRKFSIIFTLAGTVQTFGFALVVIKIRKSRSVVGLSGETFLCYTIVFAVRAVLFMIYKVDVMQFRDICLMIRLGTLSFVFSSWLLRCYRDIFYIVFG